MNFVLETRNLALKTRSCVLKTRNLALKTMNFADVLRFADSDRERRTERRAEVSKNDEFCIKNERLCIEKRGNVH